MMTKIKICGLYRNEDIDYVNLYQPDYIGFVFYSPSYRSINMRRAKELKKKLNKNILAVGVFVNEPIENIAICVKEKIIDVIQLHGKEDENYIQALKEQIPQCEIWKAFCIQSREDIKKAMKSKADKILLDYGKGEGKPFDWKLLESINRPFILAGGIHNENVKEAVMQFHPIAVDVSSGVETNREKDPQKIRAIIENVRSV